jgi:copper(I)-binding protein
MRRLSALLLLMTLCLFIALPAAAQEDEATLFVHDTGLLTEDGRNGTVYLSITNMGEQPVTLTHMTTPSGEIMLTPMDATPPTILPNETITLTPDSVAFYLSLADNAPDLASGVTLALTFSDGEREQTVITAALPVEVPPEPTTITVLAGWVRPTALSADTTLAPGDVIGGAYLTLQNTGDEADALIEVTSPIVGTVELHETRIENDIMRMRPLETLTLEAGERRALAPGGEHLMLIGLTEHLLPNGFLPLMLRFESGAEVHVALPVIDETQTPAPEATDSHGMHH